MSKIKCLKTWNIVLDTYTDLPVVYIKRNTWPSLHRSQTKIVVQTLLMLILNNNNLNLNNIISVVTLLYTIHWLYSNVYIIKTEQGDVLCYFSVRKCWKTLTFLLMLKGEGKIYFICFLLICHILYYVTMIMHKSF